MSAKTLVALLLMLFISASNGFLVSRLKKAHRASGWELHLTAKLTSLLPVRAALCGTDGTVWATNAGITSQEAKPLAKLFVDSTPAYVSGMTLFGSRYLMTRSEQKIIIGKRGSSYLVMIKTLKTVIIAAYNEPTTLEQAQKATQSFADYITGLKF